MYILNYENSITIDSAQSNIRLNIRKTIILLVKFLKMYICTSFL